MAKWQFYNKTQPPLEMASLINLSALGPYPYPSEIESHLLLIFYSSANFKKSATGSLPADNTKINGVTTVESLKHFSKSNVGGTVNLGLS